MPVIIEDGYTLPFATTVGDDPEKPLPVVSGTYRPTTFDEMQQFRYSYQRGDGKAQAKLIGELVAAHVVDWDAQQRAGAEVSALPITAVNVLRMGEPITNQLLDIVTTWAVAQQGIDSGN